MKPLNNKTGGGEKKERKEEKGTEKGGRDERGRTQATSGSL